MDASLDDLIGSVKAQGLEGLVATRLDSRYEPGQRSGVWLKMRVNNGQEFVIGGYTPSPKNFDALVIGYYQDGQLVYTARTRNGFTPALRGLQAVPRLGDGSMPIRKLAGAERQSMGARLDSQ